MNAVKRFLILGLVLAVARHSIADVASGKRLGRVVVGTATWRAG